MADERFTIAPERYALIARCALVMFTLIVVTGVAVRVTGSGLGCPTWPKCTETSLYTELNTHGVIEFGNRMLTGLVGFAAGAAFVGAFRRRPYRRDLMLLGALLPLGVVAQIVLGGFTVLFDLAPGFVMSHFMLSMLILVCCVVLDWRARREPDQLAAAGAADRVLRRASWGLFGLGAITILAGTAATAAGPHTGGTGTDDLVPRLEFKGTDDAELRDRAARTAGDAARPRRRRRVDPRPPPRRGARSAGAADVAVRAAGGAGGDRRRAVLAGAARGDRLGARVAGGGDLGGDRLDRRRRGWDAGVGAARRARRRQGRARTLTQPRRAGVAAFALPGEPELSSDRARTLRGR